MHGAWWWIDRWRKSTAYTDMTLEEQGAYRNLLDELWLRDGLLPADERILAKITGDALAWPRVRTAVMARFEVTPAGLRNLTHDEIAGRSKRLHEQRSAAGQRGNASRWGVAKPIAETVANDIAKPIANASSPSPSPSPSPISVSVSQTSLPGVQGVVRRNGHPSRASRRAPEDFELTQERKNFAFKQGLYGHEVQGEFDAFRDHEFAHGKTDWEATWKNWCRRAAKEKYGGIPQPAPEGGRR